MESEVSGDVMSNPPPHTDILDLGQAISDLTTKRNQHPVKGVGIVEYCRHTTPQWTKHHAEHPTAIGNKEVGNVATPGFDEAEAREKLSR